jgi:hypothetical protein
MKKLKYKKPKTLIEVLCDIEYEYPTWLNEDWTEEQRAELEHREEEANKDDQ